MVNVVGQMHEKNPGRVFAAGMMIEKPPDQ